MTILQKQRESKLKTIFSQESSIIEIEDDKSQTQVYQNSTEKTQ